MNIVLLSLLWVVWCTMHSILIDTAIVRRMKIHLSGLTRYYRLLYNGFSLVTIVPLVILTRMAEGPVIVSWQSYWVFLRIIFLVIALLLFRGGARQYDLHYFLGIKQLKTGEEHLLLSDKEEFSETGILGITRHPWYLGSLLFVWSALSEYTLPIFLAACILSIYLVVGTILEERKIVARHGESYCRYRQRVSMLFPWKWLIRLMR